MKRLFFIAILSFFVELAYGQTYRNQAPKVKELTDLKDVKFFSTIDTFFFRSPTRLLIRFFTQETSKFSANETEGVYRHIIISVSEYGENEPSRVFSIGPYIGPVFSAKGVDLKDRYAIFFEHGFSERRKKSKLTIYLDKILVE